MSNAMSRGIGLLAIICILACTMCAQLDRGSLTGTITDSSGAVIPEVKVRVRSTATNAVYETQSNPAGQYVLPNLPVGSYEITFEATGFKKLVRGGITLGVTEVARVDASLEVGLVTESVTITAEAPRLQSDTPMTGTSLTQRELKELPVSWGIEGRVAEFFTYKIMPGTYGDPWTSHINGSSSFSKETLLDGVTVTTYLSGHFEEGAISVEATQEFKVQTSGMAAEFGRSQAGVYNYAMKSGTNIYHGSVYGALRNEALNANTFVNNARGVGKTKDRKQNYAFSFGGPVNIPKVYHGRDKTFFYSTYERYKDRTGGLGSPSITMPLPEFLQGDFSRLLGADTGQKDALGRSVLKGAIYDPLTFKQVSPGGAWIGDVFPGNKIPTQRFSQVSQRLNKILQQYYTPTIRDSSGQIPLANNAALPVSQQPLFDYYMFSTKVDQIISSKQRISGSYSYAARPRWKLSSGTTPPISPTGGYLWSPSDTAAGATGGPLAGVRLQRVKTDLARLAHDYTISPRMLNFFSVYYNRQINPSKNPSGLGNDFDGAKDLGITGLSTHGYPTMDWTAGPFVPLNLAGYTNVGFLGNVGYGLLDTLSFSKGRHFMKAGFDYRRNMLNERPTQGGRLVFSPLSTAIPNAAFAGNLTGYSFASYLLGTVYSATLADPIGVGDRRRYFGAFFQDDFKVSSKLTLNLGLRWEYQPPFREVADRLSSWNPNKTDPLSGLKGAYDFAGNCPACTGKHSFGNGTLRDWGPRIGFAWQPRTGWTVRGAYGIFYEGDLPDAYTGTPLAKPTQVAFGGTWALSADAVTPWAGIFNWDNGFPVNRYQPASYDVSWGDKNRPGMVDPNYGHPGYIQQWNLNIQKELARHLVLDVGYVANKATGLRNGQLAMVMNQLPPAVLSQYGSRLGSAVRNAADAAANGIAYPYPGFSGTVAGALRPFPQVQGTQTVQNYGAPLGFSTYHSLQIAVNRQFTRGLSLYANYVWSKNLSNIGTSCIPCGGTNPGPLDYYNLSLEKAVTQYDVPHMFKAYMSYELPFGRGKGLLRTSNRVVNAVAGDWSVSAVLNYFSGTPLGPFTGSSPISSWNGAINRANVAAGNLTAGFDKSKFNFANLSSPADSYLNKSMFSAPAPLTLGTSAPLYTQVRNFGTISEDVSLQKNIRISERLRMQLRGDFLDIFNRHTFGGINTVVTNPLFGQVTSISGNRQIQIGARLDF